MDFDLTEEQKILKKTIRDFIKKECPKEYVRELDEKGEFPLDIYKKSVELGLSGLSFPEKYGGTDGNLFDVVIAFEELARGAMVMAFAAGCNWLFAGDAILHFGSEEQKDYYLPRMVRGEIIFSFAMTESGAGSDTLAISTSAVKDGNDYVINGNKIFITMAHISDMIMILARTDKNVPPHKGVTLFIVDAKSPGVEIRKLNMLGRRAIGTCEIFFEDVRVPSENIIGGLHQGWSKLRKLFEQERICAAAMYVGTAQAVLDDVIQYAKERVQFKKPLSKFQMIQQMIVDMQTEIESARLLTYYAAWKIVRGLPAVRESSTAKLKATETYVNSSNYGMQIMGGYGYSMEYDMQRHFRDSKAATIAGGSTQIQRIVIAKEMGL